MKLYVLTLITISSLAYSWGAPDLLKAEARQKKFEFTHNLDKKKAFQKILIWSAKSFNNSNEAIKLKDAEMGLLIAKGNIACNALKLGNDFGKDQKIEFTLEVTIEDKKAEIKATDIIGTASDSYDSGARPSTQEEMENVAKTCLEPFVESIKGELK